MLRKCRCAAVVGNGTHILSSSYTRTADYTMSLLLGRNFEIVGSDRWDKLVEDRILFIGKRDDF